MHLLKRFFKPLPIQGKITFVILVTCCAALIVVGVAILLAQSLSFRQSFSRDLEATAEIIARNSTAALAFKDPKAAQEVLSAVRAKSDILYAALELPDHSTFAAFISPDLPAPLQKSASEHLAFPDRYLSLDYPIILAGERVGILHLVSDYRAEYLRSLRVYAGILLAVLLFSVLLTLILSNRLQRLISAPILALANTAEHVATHKDYSIRALKVAQDEVGQLTDALNEMLATIQLRDSALRQTNAVLKGEIEGRKRTEAALQESRQRYEVAVLGSSDGLWDWDLAQRRFYYSPRWKQMIGYNDDELANDFETWDSRLHPDDHERVRHHLDDYLAGRLAAFEIEFRFRNKQGSYIWILSRGAALRDPQGTPFRFAGSHTDITARKEAEGEIEKLHKQLVSASRQAGMAEVATGVLHNVGNVLNSVNVSLTCVGDHLRDSEISSLVKVGELLEGQSTGLGEFLTAHPKGKLVPGFIIQLAKQLAKDHELLCREHDQLVHNVEHIKEIVAKQQSYATVSGVLENVSILTLVDDALQMHTAGLQRHGVHVERQYSEVPPLTVDKHKVLQILVNLIHNAKYALDDSGRSDRRLKVSISMNGDNRVKISVADNGIGIPPENLTRLFAHGFTTRKGGHGFGLHSGANAAKEMGGILKAQSEGIGKGATFTLELPLTTGKENS
jgi:PAS domain S-box-containing protein